MTISSMTGFAREAGTSGAHRWAWELRSVNGRNLEVRVRVPGGFDPIGEEIRREIAGTLSRGQCQLGLTLSRTEIAPRVRVDRDALAALVEAVGAISLPLNIAPASLDGLLAVRGIVEVREEAGGPEDEAALHRDLREAGTRLVAGLRAARLAEGAALSGVIAGRLDAIDALVAAATASPGRAPEAVAARLAAQVAALLGSSDRLDPARLHQEAALIAARADIREEIDRLGAHVAAARELLAAGGAVGRRLDFLAQEFGREANTLCAKAGDIALSRIGLDLKAVVDQFREQVANVE